MNDRITASVPESKEESRCTCFGARLLRPERRLRDRGRICQGRSRLCQGQGTRIRTGMIGWMVTNEGEKVRQALPNCKILRGHRLLPLTCSRGEWV